MSHSVRFVRQINAYNIYDQPVVHAFRQGLVADVFSEGWWAVAKEPIHLLAKRMQAEIGTRYGEPGLRIEMVSNSVLAMTVPGRLLIVLDRSGKKNQPFWLADVGEVNVYVSGPVEACREVYERYLPPGRSHDVGKVTWTFEVNGKLEETTIDLQDPGELPHEFYPYLDRSPEQLIDDYLADTASVLFLRGEPGTGKTTFIRRLICKAGRRALYSFDANALESDQLFVKFITAFIDILVVEDADAFIGRREQGNKTMAKFLNASDGLIKMPDKKMVVSTNLSDMSQVDDALVRPGRCFATPRFEPLTHAQAVRAAAVAGVPEPTTDEPMTLAEVFALGSKGKQRTVARDAFGFLARR